GSEATNYLNFNDVDLVTLDLHMPDVSGDKWLASERSEGLRTPVVIISETRSGEAADVVKLLSLGADHFIEKSKLSENPLALKESLLELIRSGLNSRSKPAVQRKNAPPKQRPR